jgi:hypothetical protein
MNSSLPVVNSHESEGSKITHLFHQTCLEAWINSGHPTCPLCNVVILDRRLLATEMGRSRLLLEATFRHNVREIEMILTAGSIDAATRFNVLSFLAEDNLTVLFDRVYEEDSLIENEKLVELGAFTIYQNRPEILEILLRKSHFNEKDRGQVLIFALKVFNLIGETDFSCYLLDILLRDGSIDIASHDLAISFAVYANRPDLLMRLLPLRPIFFLKVKIQTAKWMRHEEIALLLQNPELARPASLVMHLEHKPMHLCFGFIQLCLGVLLIFTGFQLITHDDVRVMPG